MSLATRAQGEELMDADDLPAATYAAVVADLARVNTVTLAARPTLAFLDRALAGAGTLRLLDVGFGDGDMLRRIARWAAKRGIAAELVGRLRSLVPRLIVLEATGGLERLAVAALAGALDAVLGRVATG